MNSMTALALRSEDESYMEGAEDGFWRGFTEGANANRRYIMGETTVNPYDRTPEEFRPLGPRWFNTNFALEMSH